MTAILAGKDAELAKLAAQLEQKEIEEDQIMSQLKNKDTQVGGSMPCRLLRCGLFVDCRVAQDSHRTGPLSHHPVAWQHKSKIQHRLRTAQV